MGIDHGPVDLEERKILRRTRLRASVEQRDSIYESVLDSSHMDFEYVSLLTLAGLIALFGLLENSAAVIIGAMLISPLMNPILSAALALLLGDGELGKRSAIVLASSVGGVIAITWLVASLTPLKQATPEILARTVPNLLDLFIAFLSGLAGTLALRGGSVALTILPGVAIAVAVVPPLAVVGYGLSSHQESVAGGAFLLFITNLVSIIISAAVVFRIMGFEPHREAEQGRWKLKYRVGISALLLFLLSIPLFLTLRKAAIEVAMRSEVQREIKSDFASNQSSVSDLSFSRMRDGLLIQATLRTTRYVGADTIRSVEETLRKKFGPGTKLLIDQILVTQGGVAAAQAARAQNPILGGVVKPVEEKTVFNFKASTRESLELVQNELDAILAGTAIQRKGTPEVDLSSDGPLVLRLGLISSGPIDSQVLSLLGSQLSSKFGLPVQLHGRIELSGPAFEFTLAPAAAHAGLVPTDRAALLLLIKRLEPEKDLIWQINCAQAQNHSGSKGISRFVLTIRNLLTASPLKSTQWSIQIAPGPEPSPQPEAAKAGTMAGASEAPAKSAVPAGPHCDVKIFQDF